MTEPAPKETFAESMTRQGLRLCEACGWFTSDVRTVTVKEKSVNLCGQCDKAVPHDAP